MAHSKWRSGDRRGGGVLRENEVRPLVRRRERYFNLRDRRAPGWRLAALAAVSAVLVLPQSAPATALAEPSITLSVGGTLGANDWYRSAVSVVWQIQPAPDPGSIVGCQPMTIGSDTRGTKVACRATWNGGADEISKNKTIKVDKTPPAISAKASRSPDANGWYNHPVGIGFSGTDATSGIAGCSAAKT